LKSVTEPFDTGSPAGRMMLQMLGVFAEFEHATIVDRVTAGLERRVREGKWMSGRLPYGYTRDKGTNLLVPDPVKASVVATHLQPGRRRQARHDRDRSHARSRVTQRAATDPRQPSALIRWNGDTHPGLHEPLVRRGNPIDFLLPGLVGRTHDLLHGKCERCWRPFACVRLNRPFTGLRSRRANATEPERTPNLAILATPRTRRLPQRWLMA
jgi:hypothetical protein